MHDLFASTLLLHPRGEAVVQAEAELDELVYALYGLTKDEIKIIEK